MPRQRRENHGRLPQRGCSRNIKNAARIELRAVKKQRLPRPARLGKPRYNRRGGGGCGGSSALRKHAEHTDRNTNDRKPTRKEEEKEQGEEGRHADVTGMVASCW